MSKKWSLIVASLSLLMSAACAYLALPHPVEALVATAPVKELGELGQGVTVPVEFELVNLCPQPVKIVNIIKSCTCTSTELSKSSLAPGEHATLKVGWSTGAARGPFGSNITVLYSQSGKSEPQSTNVRVEAQVIPDIEYRPSQVVFASGVKSERVITFSPGRDPEASVVRATSTHRALTTTLHTATSQVVVAFDPSQWPEESPVVELLVETNSTHERWIRIRVIVSEPSESTSGG